MMTKTLLPLTIIARKPGLEVIQAKLQLIHLLSQHSIPFQLDNHSRTLDGIDNQAQFTHCDLDNVKTGMLVSLGGDGSLLRAAQYAIKNQVPIVGINLGRIGFLADISSDNLHELLHIAEGQYLEDRRRLLTAIRVDDNTQTPLGLSLNEILVKGERPGKVLEFSVLINGKTCFNYHADGFLISTPTGSTAYALSAGGPIINPCLDAQMLLPICSHKMNTRPIIMPSDAEIILEISPLQMRTAVVCIDGHISTQLTPSQKVIIRKASQSLSLIHPKDFDFLSAARHKLRWESH